MHWPTPRARGWCWWPGRRPPRWWRLARTHTELAAIGLSQQYLVINGVFPAAATAADTLAAAIVEREQAALLAMPVALTRLPTDRIALKPFNLVGLDALRHLLGDSAPVEADGLPPEAALAAPSLAALVDEIALDGHGLVMLMGKGGVGKTTLAAAVAVELARRGLPVHLTTSDPAAHLAETLDGTLEHLTVSRIDPQEVTAQYRAQVLATKGAKLDAAGRAVLEEDLRSPCTEEIAVFQAFSRVIREAGKKFVVMDTAPTGHTLLLLDATGAYHRDIVRQMGSTGVHFTTPMMQLQDPKQTKVLLVTLAETTPGAGSRQPAGRPAPRRHRALGLDRQQQRGGRLRRPRPCCASARTTNCARSTPSPSAMPAVTPSCRCWKTNPWAWTASNNWP